MSPIRTDLFRSNRGVSLVEVLVAAAISLIVFGSILSTATGMSAMAILGRHYTQAMHVVRGEAEELKGTEFAAIVSRTETASYDAGPDNAFGTMDDLEGTLRVQVQDLMDFDDDDDTAETTVDVNGDGVNDCMDFPACTDPYAKPVRITFTWVERMWGASKTMSVTLDTLIAQ